MKCFLSMKKAFSPFRWQRVLRAHFVYNPFRFDFTIYFYYIKINFTSIAYSLNYSIKSITFRKEIESILSFVSNILYLNAIRAKFNKLIFVSNIKIYLNIGIIELFELFNNPITRSLGQVFFISSFKYASLSLKL